MQSFSLSGKALRLSSQERRGALRASLSRLSILTTSSAASIPSQAPPPGPTQAIGDRRGALREETSDGRR